MKNILFIIIIGLIIGLIYTNRVEGFGSTNSNASSSSAKDWFFPGTTLADIKPLDFLYDFTWVTHTPVTIGVEEEIAGNPDVMYLPQYGYLNEIDKSNKLIPYKPMNASKLYEKKIH